MGELGGPGGLAFAAVEERSLKTEGRGERLHYGQDWWKKEKKMVRKLSSAAERSWKLFQAKPFYVAVPISGKVEKRRCAGKK